jgi:MFS transporter, SP family, sugar:H+ symporter
VLAQLMSADEAEAKLAEIGATFRGPGRARLGTLRSRRYGLLPIVWVGVALSVFQQSVGINVIFYYSSALWQSVGFTEHDSLLITVITSVVNILTTFVAIALIDKIGRRRLLLIGSAAMAITLGVLTALFLTAPTAGGHPQLAGVAGPVALVAANLFVVAFGASWGPVVWVLLGEMFNNRIRALALAVGAAAQWVANFVVTLTFPPLSSAGLGVPYLLYAVFAVLSFGFVARFVRETRGRELEAM